ncbi:unnamed protein product [Prunus brigantina]
MKASKENDERDISEIENMKRTCKNCSTVKCGCKARMNTTGHSEGINSFFDGFFTPTTNLREFVVKYEQALKRTMDRESDEDFESEHKYRIVNEGEFL